MCGFCGMEGQPVICPPSLPHFAPSAMPSQGSSQPFVPASQAHLSLQLLSWCIGLAPCPIPSSQCQCHRPYPFIADTAIKKCCWHRNTSLGEAFATGPVPTRLGLLPSCGVKLPVLSQQLLLSPPLCSALYSRGTRIVHFLIPAGTQSFIFKNP